MIPILLLAIISIDLWRHELQRYTVPIRLAILMTCVDFVCIALTLIYLLEQLRWARL